MSEATESPTEALLSGLGVQPEPETESPEQTPSDSEANLQQDAPEVPETPAEDEPTQEAEPAKDLKAVAEAAGMDVKDLYGVEIPLGDDGSTMTLGEIKNRYKDLKRSDDLQAQHELQHQQGMNDLMQREQQLSAWMQETGYQPSEQMSEQMQKQFQASLAQEQALLLKMMPQWSEPSVAEAQKQDIVDLMKEYGADDSAINALHRAGDVKLLHDFAQLRKLVNGAQEAEVRPKRNQKNRGKRQQTGGSAQAAIKRHQRGEISQGEATLAILAEGMKK